MRKGTLLLLAFAGWSLGALPARGQDTNVPPTKLEAFEAQVDTVIVKGSAPMGSVSTQSGTISVRCKESKEPVTGRKEYGIALEIKDGERAEDTTVIDYDEMDALLYGIDYIGKANYLVTSLPGFDVVFTTKAGLRLAAFSSNRRQGTVQTVLQGSQAGRVRVLLSPDQLSQLQNLVQQAKNKLDSLHGK